MKKIVMMLGVALLLMSCGAKREERAFERYMDDLFIEVSNIPIEEFNFEVKGGESVPYTSLDRDIAELAELAEEVNDKMRWELVFMDELSGKLGAAMDDLNSCYYGLDRWLGCDREGYVMDDDSLVECYNRYYPMMVSAVETLLQQSDRLQLDSETRTLLGECDERLRGLPEEWIRRDVKKIGSVVEFRYEMDVDGYRKVFKTWAVYDEELDKIVRLDEGGLPMGVIMKLGIRNMFN